MIDELTYYIVAGGPSLKGYDWNLLKDKRVIAVNRAFEQLPNAEIIYFSDKRFFDEFGFGPAVLEHSGRAVTGSKLDHPQVEKYRLTGHSGLDTRGMCLRGGNNSAHAAINLAYHLGATRIIILGLDMQFNENGDSHWHGGYPVKNYEKTFEKMKPFFPDIAHELASRDILVLNANINSAVDAFERIPLEVAHNV